jgi:DnaJ-class molecular chaperone
MPPARDYYEVLGVDRRATTDEIRKAYRRLAREHHPDVSTSDDAAERFAEIGRAHEVLSDPEKRKVYDRFGHAGVDAGAAAGGDSPFGGEWSPRGAGGFDAADIGSIFEEMFGGRGASPFSGPPRSHSPRKGADIEHTVTVSFRVAAEGGEERLRLGRARGHEETIHVKIPPGTDDGARLRVKGKGQPSTDGGPAGDLLLTVEVGRHPMLRREGLDLLIDVPVSIVEASLGADVEIPLLNGSATVKIPAGARSGQKLRIKGKGIQDARGHTGNFYAVIQIAAPGQLSPHARELLETLRGELKNPRESGRWADVGSQG